MKRLAVVLALLALAAAAVAPASAGKRASSLTKGLDLSLDGPLRGGGVRLTEDTAALSSVTNDRLSRSLNAGRISPARFALERAESALEGDFDGHLSLVLTDLALRVRDLSGADRERALEILARPTDQDTDANIDHVSYRNADVNASCTDHFCVHWTDTGRHAVADDDADPNTTPAYVETVKLEMENVWSVIVDDLGFRAPKSDVTSENTVPAADAGKLDVYLVEAGSDGVYGYCTTDDPNLIDRNSGYEYFDGSAYCALDDDFAPAQFGGAPAEESLRVTAAHEFFHAVQLAYAAGHDTWMSEGTATMMEDVVHDDVDDNYQYLSVSALRTIDRTTVPMDFGSSPFHYGAWLWWRFLTEVDQTGGLPIIRETWEQAALDGPTAPGLVSTSAIKRALADHDVSFAAAKAFFSAVNYVPEAFYEEGPAYLAELNNKRPAPMGTFTLGGSKKTTGPLAGKLDHLSAGYVVFKPGTGVSKLRIGVDLPAAATSPSASILVLYADGTVSAPVAVPVNANGVGSLRAVPYQKGQVRSVVLVLDNASTRFKNCFRRNTPWTCSGVPVDNGLSFQLSGAAS